MKSTMLMAAGVLGQMLAGQTLQDFGYQRLAAGGPTTGTRPVVAVLMQYGAPLAHDASYFNRMLSSASGYFLENSHGYFRLAPVGSGVYGPFAQPAPAADGNAALQALSDAGFTFANFDANGDGVVDQTELTVVAIDNVNGVNGVTYPGGGNCFAPATESVNVCLNVISTGDQVSLMTVVREIVRQLGAVDLSGSAHTENFQFTPMGATQFSNSNDLRTFHLDPWHKMLLGWTRPAIYSLDAAGTATLNAVQLINGDPVILFSASKGTNEFYMLEYRNGRNGTYDADVDGGNAGLTVWHVATMGNGGDLGSDLPTVEAYDLANATMSSVFIQGAPYFTRGTGHPYGSQMTTGWLTWLDGSCTQTKVMVGDKTNKGDSLQISWDVVSTPQPHMDLIFHNTAAYFGASGYVDPVNAQVPTIGSFFFAAWTHVISGGANVLCYDSHSGDALLGIVDRTGNFQVTHNLPRFSAGWTHIVVHKNLYFFYNASSGLAAVGEFYSNGVFHQYKAWTSFSRGWTHIVSTPNGLLFYNANNGSGAAGDWVIQTASFIGTIVSVDFKQSTSYGAGSLNYWWSQVVNTSNGVLFYNAASGLMVMADLTANGTIATRPPTVQNIAAGYTSVVSDGVDVFFYNSTTGDGAVGNVADTASGSVEMVPQHVAGSVVFRRMLPGGLAAGWTGIVPVYGQN